MTFRNVLPPETPPRYFEQMPAVGHLLRLRRRLTGGRAITWTTVATDDLLLRVLA
jgi:hypothetical protein